MSLKTKITSFINDLIIYDYILFGTIFVLFILFIILAIVVRQRVGLSIFLLLLSLSLLLLGPTIGYTQMHNFLYKNIITLTSQKKLTFTQAIVIKGTLSNDSKFDFQSCKISATAYKFSKNPIKSIIYPFKPIKKASIVIENIPKGKAREFKMFIEPFTYSNEYNISLEARCK